MKVLIVEDDAIIASGFNILFYMRNMKEVPLEVNTLSEKDIGIRGKLMVLSITPILFLIVGLAVFLLY